MKVKIDTKEKFNVISINEPILSANMTEELEEKLLMYLNSLNKNVVLKIGDVTSIDETVAHKIANVQQAFYESNASFVICELQKPVEEFLDKLEILEVMNITPTESEAWDIIQMEEIEREFDTPNPY